MSRIFLSLSLLAVVVAFSACSREDPGFERPVPYFNSINVGANVTANIRVGDQRVEVLGDGNLSGIITEVLDDELFIYGAGASNVIANIWVNDLRQVLGKDNSRINFPENFVSISPDLNILGRNASAIRVNQTMVYDSVYVELRDASNLGVIDLDSRVLFGDLRNGTRCNIEGFSEHLELIMTDGCRFNLDFPDASYPFIAPMQSVSCAITARNGANAWVFPTDYLNAKVSDGSVVFYKGNPANIDQEVPNGGQLLTKDN
ncbi:MAG: DUF2807 domain-containing protein [Bacteroidota bacterium]